MAANSRFDMPPSSQDGSNFGGPRSQLLSPSSLERPGSFRENHHESRSSILSLNLPGLGTSSQTELLPLSQVLSLEMLSLEENKYARQVDLRRVINSAVSSSTEVSSSGVAQAKSLASLVPDELKRVKASVSENRIRARGRVKFLDEAIMKLEKYRLALMSRKRLRSELPASERPNNSLTAHRAAGGGSLLKSGLLSSQNHANSNSVDPGSRIVDERNKNAVPNKRVRTSMADLEGRLNNSNSPRPSGMLDRERDLFKSGSSGLSQAEDKDCALPPGKGGWEKLRLKRRRSGIKSDITLSSTANAALDGDREHKLGVQHKLNHDSRLRPSEGHGFRSGPVHGIVSMHKLESFVQQNGSNVRVMTREEPEGGTFASEKSERSVGLEKDRTVIKSGTKSTMREECQTANSTVITKGKASRAPRSNSVVSTNSSPRFVRASSTFDVWERPSGTNRAQNAIDPNNRKCTAPTRSSSPPVAQWVGQRPTKMARIARRMNLVPPTPNQVETTGLAEGFPYRDAVNSEGNKPDPSVTSGSAVQGHLSNNSTLLQNKSKSGNLSSATPILESEELQGGGDNKSLDKNKKNTSVEGKFGPGGQKLGTLVLPTKKTKVVPKEGSGDGVRRQGRSGRGLVSGRISGCLAGDKIDSTSTAKLLRSTRPIPDKVESKPSRLPTKKSASERKPLSRPRRPVNSGSSDLTGESDDDREELLAAVEAAVNSSNLACSGLFWKEMEHHFAILTQQDLDFLKQQVELICNASPASSSPTFLTQQTCLSSGNVDNDASRLFGSLKDTTSSGKCVAGRWLDKMLPLSQRLLAALIVEEKNEEETHMQDDGGQCENFHYTERSPWGTCSQIDTEPNDSNRVEPETAEELIGNTNDKLNSSPYACHKVSNGDRNYLSEIPFQTYECDTEADNLEDSESDIFEADLGNLDVRCARGWQKNKDKLQYGYQAIGMVSAIATYEIEYQQMCLDDRILLELHSIGMFPETVPDLALREGDGIKEELQKLQNELLKQVGKNKAHIYELEKAVFRRREEEDREREHLAMNKLVEIAFNRHMGCRSTNVSENKTAGGKVAKQAALAFAKRTLDRCQNFNTTGRSCFREASLKERLFFITSRDTHTKPLEDVTLGEILTANENGGGTAGPPDVKPSDISIVASENAGRLVVRRIQSKDKGGKEQANTCQATSSPSELISAKDDSWSMRGKKKELLLEHVVGSSTLTDAPVLGSALLGGTKGKRSEREQEGKGYNKESIIRINNFKGVPQGVSIVKGERKNKNKSKQKTAQLSKAVNCLLAKSTVPKESLSILTNLGENTGDKNVKVNEFKKEGIPGIAEDLQCNTEGAIDLSHLQLPGMEDLVVNDELGGQGQDLGSWLNFEDDVLQDAAGDFVGLDVPMDDLSDLAMMV